jgi:hypothetical protein
MSGTWADTDGTRTALRQLMDTATTLGLADKPVRAIELK